MSLRAKGWIPSGQKPTGTFRAAAHKFGSVGDGTEFIIPMFRPPKDQKGSSCTANSRNRQVEIVADIADAGGLAVAAAMKNLSDFTPTYPERSDQLLYWEARRLAGGGMETRDDGCFIHSTGEVYEQRGVCPKSFCPDDEFSLCEKPADKAFVEAYAWKLDSFARYSLDPDHNDFLDQVEIAVRAAHPPNFGAYVKEVETYNGDPSTIFYPPQRGDGHAMLVVGVRGLGDFREFAWLTSWGPFGIAARGIFWVSSSYMVSAEDVDVVTLAPR